MFQHRARNLSRWFCRIPLGGEGGAPVAESSHDCSARPEHLCGRLLACECALMRSETVESAPERLRNPFEAAQPHPLAREAAEALMEEIARLPIAQREDAAAGKMFGVLIVCDGAGRIGTLRAFAGMLGGRWDVDGFVGPVRPRLKETPPGPPPSASCGSSTPSSTKSAARAPARARPGGARATSRGRPASRRTRATKPSEHAARRARRAAGLTRRHGGRARAAGAAEPDGSRRASRAETGTPRARGHSSRAPAGGGSA